MTTPPVSLVRSHERTSDDRAATPGMHRQLAYDRDGAWVGVVHTESGATSGWHHHGDWDTYVYIASGAQRVEFGGGGQENLLAGPGDVIHVAKGVVHRESNPALPGSENAETETFVVRVGSGPLVVNVDGPDS